MKELLDFSEGFNVQTILSMTLVLWYFTRGIRNEIKDEIKEIRQENKEQSKRSDKLYQSFISLLNRKN